MTPRTGSGREMFTKWRAAVEDSVGTIVKTAGDGFMAVFPTGAGNAVRAADTLRAAMSTIDSPRPLRLRIGVAAGEASHEDGDWFGTPVVEAARLCGAADPDEVLLSETARNLVGSRGGHDFTAVGSLALKGLARPVPTYALGSGARRRRTRRPTKWVAAAVGVALLVGGTVVAVAESGNDETTGSASGAQATGIQTDVDESEVHTGGVCRGLHGGLSDARGTRESRATARPHREAPRRARPGN